MTALLADRDAQIKKINAELRDRRHALKSSGEGKGKIKQSEGEGEGDEAPRSVTEEDLKHIRSYDREFARLESELEPELLSELEEEAEALPPAARARFVSLLRRGLAARKAETAPAPREGRRGTESGRTTGEPSPRPRSGPDLPETWEEYEAWAKTDPKRKAAVDKLVRSGDFSLSALRAKRRK